jgi:hypothetical protein
MKTVLALFLATFIAVPAFATDTMEDLMKQITFTGKVGDRKVFSSDAQLLLEMGLQFPAEFAKLKADGAKIYWTQMSMIPTRNEGTGPEYSVIAATFYASNKLCSHPMCQNPPKAEFRVLTLLQKTACQRGIADAGCAVSLSSNGMTTKTMDSLFWLSEKPLD